MAMPMMAFAQSTLTPQEQLEQAQKQLEEAQKALEQAKANAARAQAEAKAREEAAAKAKAEAEAKAKAEAAAKAKADEEARQKAAEIQKKIDEMKRETARLEEEAANANAIQPNVTPEAPTSVKSEEKVPTTTVVTPEPAKEAATPTETEEAPTETTATPTIITAGDTNISGASKKSTKSTEIKTRLAPVDDDDDNESDKSIYLAKDAVPLVNGKVVWTAIIKAPGKTADEIYNITEKYLTALTSDKLQLEGSQVAIKNPEKHNLTATVHEWLIFRNTALSLDRTEFYYVLNAICSNGQVELTMGRLRYKYDSQGKVDNYNAENWITDKDAVNKKHTRLFPISGKFRKKTIDRKNEIFETLAAALQ